MGLVGALSALKLKAFCKNNCLLDPEAGAKCLAYDVSRKFADRDDIFIQVKLPLLFWGSVLGTPLFVDLDCLLAPDFVHPLQSGNFV